MNQPGLTQLLEIVVGHVDIPKSYYQKAAARHQSVGEWLNRPSSSLVNFRPDVRAQGSFRYGTVIQPLDRSKDYDLDNIALLSGVSVIDVTQQQVKQAYGAELHAYAKAQGMKEVPEEHNRCWRLAYADEVGFHLDSLPCLGASGTALQDLRSAGILERFASVAVAITDRRHREYRVITGNWRQSNPRGFARWFESRAALGREQLHRAVTPSATVEEIPPYEWKTTLQRGIQLLKRHRDVMFREAPDLAPISMIITNLAANAYTGERDLATALIGIVDDMPQFVRANSPRVPNPVLPTEDYADKWRQDSQLERNFWYWHTAIKADLANLASALETGRAGRAVQRMFAVELFESEERGVREKYSRPLAVPSMIIAAAPRPWGR